MVEDVIRNIRLYGITQKREIFDEFAVLLPEAATAVHELIAHLQGKHDMEALQKAVIHIHELEDRGDTLYEKGISELFSQEQDPLLIMKWKDIITDLENIMDQFQSVSDTVESIVVKAQ